MTVCCTVQYSSCTRTPTTHLHACLRPLEKPLAFIQYHHRVLALILTDPGEEGSSFAEDSRTARFPCGHPLCFERARAEEDRPWQGRAGEQADQHDPKQIPTLPLLPSSIGQRPAVSVCSVSKLITLDKADPASSSLPASQARPDLDSRPDSKHRHNDGMDPARINTGHRRLPPPPPHPPHFTDSWEREPHRLPRTLVGPRLCCNLLDQGLKLKGWTRCIVTTDQIDLDVVTPGTLQPNPCRAGYCLLLLKFLFYYCPYQSPSPPHSPRLALLLVLLPLAGHTVDV